MRFLGAEGKRIFSVLSLPQGRIKGGVVLAPSLLTDRVRSYRAEVKAARQLANLGLAVLRFDYRGFGHSDGETGVTDARRLLEDLETASGELQDLLKEEDVAMVGSRFGSLLVANRNVPTRRAVLWDPLLSGAEYFRTAFRAQMVGQIHRSGLSTAPNTQLENDGRANVLGYNVSRLLVESVTGLQLAAGTCLNGADVLWIESAAKLTAARAQAADRLRSDNVNLVTRLIPGEDPGWFIGVRPLEGHAAVGVLVKWLSSETSR